MLKKIFQRFQTLIRFMRVVPRVINLRIGNITPVYVDIGAAGGMPFVWRKIIDGGYFKSFLFDFSDEWTDRKNVTILKYVVAGESGERTLFETRHPGCASICEPNSDFVERFYCSNWFTIEGRNVVQAVALSELLETLQIDNVDVLKTDIQGCDGEVLTSLGKHLDNICAVETELQLFPLYHSKHSFSDVINFMNAAGFALRDLQAQGPFGNELVEFNAFWSRRDLDPRQEKIVSVWEVANSIRKPILETDLADSDRSYC